MPSKKRIIDSICDGIVEVVVNTSEALCMHSWYPCFTDLSTKRCVKCFAERKITEKSTLLRIFFCEKDFIAVSKEISAEDLKKSLSKNIPIIKEKVCLCCGTTKYIT